MKTILIATLSFAILSIAQTKAADNYPLKTCVVSGDLFGGDLGPPVKIDYKGRTLILCCNSCVKKFNRDPEKYMHILDTAVKAAK